MRPLTYLAIAVGITAGGAVAADRLIAFEVRGDGIPAPLTQERGDPARGRALIITREANCLLCHPIAETRERFMGNIGPPLSGVGGRLTTEQLRLRVVDPTIVNRDTVMPAYYRVANLNEVAQEYRGKPILSAQQVEDVVAYLATLR